MRECEIAYHYSHSIGEVVGAAECFRSVHSARDQSAGATSFKGEHVGVDARSGGLLINYVSGSPSEPSLTANIKALRCVGFSALLVQARPLAISLGMHSLDYCGNWRLSNAVQSKSSPIYAMSVALSVYMSVHIYAIFHTPEAICDDRASGQCQQLVASCLDPSH